MNGQENFAKYSEFATLWYLLDMDTSNALSAWLIVVVMEYLDTAVGLRQLTFKIEFVQSNSSS